MVLCAEAYENNRAEQFIKSKTDKEKLIAVRDLINERVQDHLLKRITASWQACFDQATFPTYSYDSGRKRP